MKPEDFKLIKQKILFLNSIKEVHAPIVKEIILKIDLTRYCN